MEKLKKEMESQMASQLEKLISCENKDMRTLFRELSESIQAYCTFRTLAEKYSSNDSAE